MKIYNLNTCSLQKTALSKFKKLIMLKETISARILIQLWHKYVHNIHFIKYIVQILLDKIGSQ